MVSALLIGMGFLFFILGHSTLLFFKSEEMHLIPIRDVIIPWPKKGRLVSIFCLILSLSSFFLAVFLPSATQSLTVHAAEKLIVVFAVLPSVIYAAYLGRRIRRYPEGLLYASSEIARQEWSIPLFFSAVCSALFWIFK